MCESTTTTTTTVAPKWAIASYHAATVEEDTIREAPVVPTGGQASRKICFKNHDHQSFPRTLAIKFTEAGEICGASREAQNIKRMRGCSAWQ